MSSRLTAVNGASVTNDANGNLTAYNGKTYTWDVRGRLASLTAPSYSGVYTYDYQDRRASKMVNGASTWYRYDGDDLIGEISSSGVRFTLQGPDIDEPLAQFDGSFRNGLYPTPNHLGSSTALAGPSGYVQSWYYYRPFGQTTQSNGGLLGETRSASLGARTMTPGCPFTEPGTSTRPRADARPIASRWNFPVLHSAGSTETTGEGKRYQHGVGEG